MRARDARSSAVRAASISRRRSASSASRRSVMSKITPSIHSRPPKPDNELAAVEHPAHHAVGAHDPVFLRERALRIGAVATSLSTFCWSSGWMMLMKRPAVARDEVVRRVARDPLDLVGDQLEPVAGVPRRAVDRAGDRRHQRPQQRVVGALVHGAQARARPGEQLHARERPVQVVVGADVGDPAAGRGRDREQPGAAQPGVLAQRDADAGDVEAVRLAVGDHEIGRLLAQRRERGLDARDRPRGVPGRVQPRTDLRLGGADQQHARLAPPDRSRARHHT